MVKTIVSIFLSVGIIVGLSLWEASFLNNELDDFNEVLQVLYLKTEEETATAEDGEAVKSLWNDTRDRLHFWVPHTSVSYVDYWLSEAVGCLRKENYQEAAPKLEVLLDICRGLKSSFGPSFGNVF
ncbi:MAG: DUF4363 family protein [Christensenellaceae bacterium]